MDYRDDTDPDASLAVISWVLPVPRFHCDYSFGIGIVLARLRRSGELLRDLSVLPRRVDGRLLGLLPHNIRGTCHELPGR